MIYKGISNKLPSGRVLDYGDVKLDEGEERQNWVVHQFKHNKKVPMRAWEVFLQRMLHKLYLGISFPT